MHVLLNVLELVNSKKKNNSIQNRKICAYDNNVRPSGWSFLFCCFREQQMIEFPAAICGRRRVAKNSTGVSLHICPVDANQLWEASRITDGYHL